MSVDFVHLHLHSDYSMLDGACQIKRLCSKVKEMGQSAVAVTDHGNMFATLDLYWAAQKAGIKPIVGCEFYLTDNKLTDKNNKKRYHLVLLAKDYEGYQSLCHLNEIAWSADGFYYKPRIDRDALRKFNKGLICTSACIGGEIQQHLLKDNEAAAREALEFYIEIFGREDFYLEIQFHAKPGMKAHDARTAEQRELLELEDKVNKKFVELSKEYGVELVCTNDAHYLNEEDAEAHDALLCIGTQSNLSDAKRFRFACNQFYVKSGEEMAEIFKEYPRAVENTVKIADKCNLVIPFGVNHYPIYDLEYAKEMADSGFAPPLPEKRDDITDKNCPIRGEYLRQICHKGLLECYNLKEPDNEDYIPQSEDEPSIEFRKEILDRMTYELGVIDKMGFISYFLVVWDFINYARSIDVPVGPGRGSGAGSLVAYITRITNLDPLLYGLLFERFLNPDRVSPPDFDIDFCERRRGEVIDYVRQKYGQPSVAQIGTFGTLKAKAVLKDVARVMGVPFSDANRLVGAIPTDPKMTLAKAIAIPEVKQMHDSEGWIRDMFAKATILEGLNRNQSIHACGVIIGDQPLANVVPLARGAGKELITQFPAFPCEELGLLKMDFLGLKTLTVIQDTIDMLNAKSGNNFTPDDIPIIDQPTFNLLNRGQTVGVFQLESGGMQELCRSFGIEKIEEIIALVALYRPGPMEFIPTFVACKFGREKPDYDTPEMEKLLSETYGIMVYQEQIMQVVQAVAGFSLAQADIMRRAIGKKKEAVLIEQGVLFREGCQTMGHSLDTAESIWQKILKFASYGFNKSHSACYGLLSYRTAYLKANHPAEFMSSVLNAEINNAEKLGFYIAECKEMGIQILPPDVNVSAELFGVDGDNIRFGIAGLKGVGSNAAAAIINAQEGGEFNSLVDFCERTGSKVNKRVMDSLCKAGAFDGFGMHRSQVLVVIDQALGMAQQTIKDRERGQASLFDMFDDNDGVSANDLSIPDIPEWDEKDLLTYEKELLGFYVSGHPLGENADLIRRYGTYSIAKITEFAKKDMGILTGGMINAVKIVTTKKGDKMAIVDIEDLEGHIEVIVFPKTYAKCSHLIEPDKIVFMSAFVDMKEQSIQLLAENMWTIEEMLPEFTKEVHLRLYEAHNNNETVDSLIQLCKEHRGNVPLVICVSCLNDDIGFVRTHVSHSVDMSKEFIDKAKALLGNDAIHYKPDHSKIPEKQQRRWQKQAD